MIIIITTPVRGDVQILGKALDALDLAFRDPKANRGAIYLLFLQMEGAYPAWLRSYSWLFVGGCSQWLGYHAMEGIRQNLPNCVLIL